MVGGRIRDGMRVGGNYLFVTLTFDRPIEADEAMRCWKKFRRGIRPFRFFRVMELTKRKRPHFHFVTSTPLAEVDKPRHGEMLVQWLRRQSEAARELSVCNVDV